MARLRVCFEIDGLGVDKNGEACPVGLQMDLGEVSKDIPYEELAEDVNIAAVLKFIHLDHIPVSAVRIITPEEYDQKYGEEDHED